MDQATFAAGCFWGVEEDFLALPGVINTVVGYTGGEMPNPTYNDVCRTETGHAEAVRVTFDPAQISYEQLVEKFWELHDPTQMNRQGPDVGTQYRSVIFFHTPEQKLKAEESKAKAQANFKRPIATAIVPVEDFYQAEEYHQRYFEKQGVSHRR